MQSLRRFGTTNSLHPGWDSLARWSRLTAVSLIQRWSPRVPPLCADRKTPGTRLARSSFQSIFRWSVPGQDRAPGEPALLPRLLDWIDPDRSGYRRLISGNSTFQPKRWKALASRARPVPGVG